MYETKAACPATLAVPPAYALVAEEASERGSDNLLGADYG